MYDARTCITKLHHSNSKKLQAIIYVLKQNKITTKKSMGTHNVWYKND